jgi:hypothetical protein
MWHLPFLEEAPYLGIAQLAFMIWMLVDCQRRGAEQYWFWIILMIPGIGAWVYFFTHKIHDFRGRGSGGLNFWPFDRRANLTELRYRVQQTPTLANQLALGERLTEKGEHADAVPYLEAVLGREPDHTVALYSLASCRVETGHPDLAIPVLRRLLSKDWRYGNYAGWRLLVTALVRTGDESSALVTARELVQKAPMMEHKCLLAERLHVADLPAEARELLESALRDFQFAPWPVRRRDGRWKKRAWQILREHK